MAVFKVVPTSLGSRKDIEGSSPNQVEGYVDDLTRWMVRGWAWRPTTPEDPVHVQAILHGKLIGAAAADRYREDLAGHGKGTGCYGFEIVFSSPLPPGEAPTISVFTRSEKTITTERRAPTSQAATWELEPPSLDSLISNHAYFTAPGPKFENFDPTILSHIDQKDRDLTFIAFYLPQFHPLEENDYFWGRGFTEWRQLSRAIPRFPGHYQPRSPRDLGFYDLRSTDVIRQQAALAASSGINCFGYYYYWFNGKRILDAPIEAFLASDVNQSFMLIWANENWTRTWDGLDEEILLHQTYNLEHEDALLENIARHFRDERYLRIAGRPLFVIYNPRLIPDCRSTIARWRDIWESKFALDPFIFMAQTFDETDPRKFGLDGALEFPPHKLGSRCIPKDTKNAYSKEFSGTIHSYSDFVDASLSEPTPAFPIIKTVVPSWDNEARRPNKGYVLQGSSPELYQSWLEELSRRALERPINGKALVAINAWNEWAEAAYLEPDVHFGSAYLNATARSYATTLANRISSSLRQAEFKASGLKVSVVVPNYNHAKFLKARLESIFNQSMKPHEIIFLDDASADNSIEVARALLNECDVPYRILANKENSGNVFRQWIKGIEASTGNVIWIAESDDTADLEFLSNVSSELVDPSTMIAFGRIEAIDADGNVRNDLRGYYDCASEFSWQMSRSIASAKAFLNDFAIKNIIPNVSGAVFRRPLLSSEELARLYEYRFAGDWLFYALASRGGRISYVRDARSYFRINQTGASRSRLFSDRHVIEHSMILSDLSKIFGLRQVISEKHIIELLKPFPEKFHRRYIRQLRKVVTAEQRNRRALRICIGSHSFSVGGGEILPIELANELRSRGHHVTFVIIESDEAGGTSVRHRLRTDIPVVLWKNIRDKFSEFLEEYSIDVFNSHNVGFEIALHRMNCEMRIPYIASLHGGYETVTGLLTPSFVSYVGKTVSRWLYLSEKNIAPLLAQGMGRLNMQKSFNALPKHKSSLRRARVRSKYKIEKRTFGLILCSRALHTKGWQTAIDVVEILHNRSPGEFHLTLVGGGPDYESIYGANKEKDFVTFLGHHDNPAKLFGAFDLGIFPSVFEGETFPLFLLECFMAGLPVVATDIGEISTLMSGDENDKPGILLSRDLSKEDMTEQMCAAVRSLKENKSRYRRCHFSALRIAEYYTMDRLVESYLSTYQATCATAGKAADT